MKGTGGELVVRSVVQFERLVEAITGFDLAHGKNQSSEIFTAAKSGDRLAFSTGNRCP